MTTITSKFLSQQVIKEALQQTDHERPLTSTPPVQDSQASVNAPESSHQQILAEIQSIQQALLEEDFDLSQLEAPAAGNVEASLSNGNESTFSSPVLMNEDSLLIAFRSSEAVTDRQSNANILNNELEPGLFVYDETADTVATNNAESTSGADRLTGFVSEDFLTRTQGNFDANLAIDAQNITTAYGNFISNEDGSWSYELNNSALEIQSLASGDSQEDRISLITQDGNTVELIIAIQGNNDQAQITGQKTGSLSALPAADTESDLPIIQGKLNVSDIDNNEAFFNASTSISGNFGNAEITASGEWRYTLNNDAQAVQGLKGGEKLYDLFSVKTLDGSKQLIQITIEGTDDAPLLGGSNIGVLDLASQINSSGSLTINDPDFGESRFMEASGIESTLGYGVGSINSQGEWLFTLDPLFTQNNPISSGETQIDSFDIVTADGTRQTINIPIQGSDQPLFAQTDNTLKLDELISAPDPLDEFNFEPAQTPSHTASAEIVSIFTSSHSSDAMMQNTQIHSNDIGLI
jgi:VCBS repeat-containing protein